MMPPQVSTKLDQPDTNQQQEVTQQAQQQEGNSQQKGDSHQAQDQQCNCETQCAQQTSSINFVNLINELINEKVNNKINDINTTGDAGTLYTPWTLLLIALFFKTVLGHY